MHETCCGLGKPATFTFGTFALQRTDQEQATCAAPVSNMGGARAQYFRDVDDALERADEVHVAIEAAVSNEAYGVAAALRGGLAELEARDTVGSVLQARPLIARHAIFI